jgi:hypothetical protein
MRYMNPVVVALISLVMGTATDVMADTKNLTCHPGSSITRWPSSRPATCFRSAGCARKTSSSRLTWLISRCKA